ncbi:MAG: hypothetical protein ACXACD_18355 [Candidatus Thorarchaeota archaeon]|jgi:hypothetical protein
MRISKRLSVALLAAFFLVTLVSAVPTEAKKPHRWYSDSTYMGGGTRENPTWVGHIWNEDGYHGDFYWLNLEWVFMGNEQHFWGIWWINWDDGGHIEGTHKGSFTYALMQYNIKGWIYEAYAGSIYDYSDLDGRKIHTLGVVSEFWTSQSIFQIN